jgi:thiamine kinase-like enzyme
MNQKHQKFICTELQLGSSAGVAIEIYGSRGGHIMWRVNTDKGNYAIKQLAPDVDLKSERMITKYELSESVAYRFTQYGIPAVVALKKHGKYLIIIENMGYLVYPWIEGYTLGRNEISETHALKVAEMIAKLHNINLSVSEMREPHVDVHTDESIVDAINKAVSFKCPFSKTLKEDQKVILSMNDSYLAIVPLLLEQTVVTHGDLDQLNILWNNADQPNLIDWESTRKLNPTREIVRASLGWSGIGAEDFSLSIYEKMLHTYTKSGGKISINHVNAALYSMVGSMVNWILYNIERACTDAVSSTRDTATKEINGAVMSMKRLKILLPDLLDINQEIRIL